jgi:transcriptional regulator with XRE-family HTH domain
MLSTLQAEMPRRKRAGSEFGERLAALRKQRGLTQVQLAEAMGATQRAMSYYENECDFPPGPVLIELARVLKVSTDELLGVKATKGRRTAQDAPETRRVWKKFQQVMRLPEKDRRAVIRLVNSLVETTGRSAAGGSR